MAKRKRSPQPEEPDEPGAPGWDAIDAAFDRLYPGQEPRHYGTIVSWALGGNDPLDGISAYKALTPRPHWHVVTYGMSELYSKESRDPAVSGWGIEFTLRLACKPKDREPPMWALNFLQNLGRYVFETGNVFGANHHMDLNGPIALEDEKTLIRAIAFAHDPQIPKPINTPNGRLEFLQVVGITPDELAAIAAWNTAGFLRELARHDPLLVTDLRRRSILDDPATARRVRAATGREGSSLAGVRTPEARWKLGRGKPPAATLTVGAGVVGRLAQMLAGRTRHGRPFDLWAGGQTVRFVPGKRAGWRTDGDVLTVRLTPELADELRAGLKPARGAYTWDGLKRFTLAVVPTEIRDDDGNLVEVVG